MKFYNGTSQPISNKIKAGFSRFVQDLKDMLNPDYEEPWEMFPEDFDTDEEYEEYLNMQNSQEGDDDYEEYREEDKEG